jgi:hypothetical protein
MITGFGQNAAAMVPTPSASVRTKNSRGEPTLRLSDATRARSAPVSFSEYSSAIGCTPDIADDELHSREADAGVRHRRGTAREIGIAKIDHDMGARQLQRVGRQARDLERHIAVVHTADLATGAGHSDMLASMQRSGR